MFTITYIYLNMIGLLFVAGGLDFTLMHAGCFIGSIIVHFACKYSEVKDE